MVIVIVALLCISLLLGALYVYSFGNANDSEGTYDAEDTVDAVDAVDTVNTVDTEDTVDTVDTVDAEDADDAEDAVPMANVPVVTSINGLSQSDVDWIEASDSNFKFCAYVEEDHQGMYKLVNTSSIGVLGFEKSDEKLKHMKAYMSRSQADGKSRDTYQSVSYNHDQTKNCVVKDIHGVEIKPSDKVRIFSRDNKLLHAVNDNTFDTAFTQNAMWKMAPDAEGNFKISPYDDASRFLVYNNDDSKLELSDTLHHTFQILRKGMSHALVYKTREGYDRNAGDIDSGTDGTIEDCRLACSENTDCVGYSYANTPPDGAKKCYIKKSEGLDPSYKENAYNYTYYIKDRESSYVKYTSPAVVELLPFSSRDDIEYDWMIEIIPDEEFERIYNA